ncbi:NAD(P)-dependent oxidoreductase [Lacibacterium aquatile]|uniref:NAD(P)-dependent oxidoreductase n=1 Tax=Lacibacterium aquatile TaxID=1168082 RepID=A0ABW5DUX9_9PROT
MNIAVLGIGLMGAPMARRLIAAGYQVTLWNRTAAKAEALAGPGVRIALMPADAVRDADLTITMLENGPVVEAVVAAIGDALKPGSLLVDMSSIPPDTARAHYETLGARGIAAIDAPVSGGPSGAEAGTLAIMAGGDEEAVERARPVLVHLGRVTRVGPPGTGQLSKLCNQLIVGAAIGAVSEALILAEKGGADPAKVREALSGGFADSKILAIHGQRMLDRSFIPGGAASVHLKDMVTIQAAARGNGLDLPLASLIHRLFEDLCRNGEGAKDHSALFRQIAREAGAEDLI